MDSAETDWLKYCARTEEEIRAGIEADPEIHPTDAAFWNGARLVIPEAKETVTIQLDRDLMDWLKEQKGYPTQINAVLRAYMEANVSPGRP